MTRHSPTPIHVTNIHSHLCLTSPPPYPARLTWIMCLWCCCSKEFHGNEKSHCSRWGRPMQTNHNLTWPIQGYHTTGPSSLLCQMSLSCYKCYVTTQPTTIASTKSQVQIVPRLFSMDWVWECLDGLRKTTYRLTAVDGSTCHIHVCWCMCPTNYLDRSHHCHNNGFTVFHELQPNVQHSR